MKLVLAVTLALTVSASTLAANPMDHALADARQLMESCESPSPMLRAMCLGYLAAVSDEVKTESEQPDGRPAFGVVRASFARRWPC